MDIRQAYHLLIEQLSPRYGEREARAIGRIYFEDAWGWKAGTGSREISDEDKNRLDEDLKRLLQGEPVQYVVGQADFYGRSFRVGPAVLIPRPETEELVEWAVELLRHPPLSRVLDIGTGSGCIPITLKLELPHIRVSGTDISPDALELARLNARRYDVGVDFILHDILQPDPQLPDAVYDLIISNPPYIPRAERELMPEHVLRYEPHLALFVEDADPLLFYQQITRAAASHLAPGGALLFECNEYNARRVSHLLAAQGFQEVTLRQDLQGKDRMVLGRRP